MQKDIGVNNVDSGRGKIFHIGLNSVEQYLLKVAKISYPDPTTRKKIDLRISMGKTSSHIILPLILKYRTRDGLES